MYKDAYTWNVFVGCREFWCSYCKKSFQAQMKRRMPKFDKDGNQYRGCQQCYDYAPHFHEERLIDEYTKKHFPKTKGDEFIWVGSSGDISFIKEENMEKILRVIKGYPDRTFFFQTKNPSWFNRYSFPDNVILGITLESNRWYKEISNAPTPFVRINDFYRLKHPRKIFTIEPILDFDFPLFLGWLKQFKPERIYVGYDTHKTWWMKGKERIYLREYEPSLEKTKKLILELERFTKVKTKYMKEGAK